MFKEYRDFVSARPWVKVNDPELLYSAAAMTFEAGEAGDVIKKLVRGDKNVESFSFVLEAGDMMYYLQKTLEKLGYTLEEVLFYNMQKLKYREKFGKEHNPSDILLWTVEEKEQIKLAI